MKTIRDTGSKRCVLAGILMTLWYNETEVQSQNAINSLYFWRHNQVRIDQLLLFRTRYSY